MALKEHIVNSNQHPKVSLVTDLNALVEELVSEQVWMVHPKMHRKYATQRMTMTAEIVDLDSINLAKVQTFETL
jgi:hypothetical protein